MRIVALIGNHPNQHALCAKLAREHDLAAVVVSANVPQRRRRPMERVRRYTQALAARTAGRPLTNAWRSMMERYAASIPLPAGLQRVEVSNVNDDGTLQTLQRHRPELVVVSGTNLVGRRVIEEAQRLGGIVNLHTGVSPYLKGGPNCTNWCLAERKYHLIGNTIMWIDPGIDTGNIVTTEVTPLDGKEGLDELHWRVMEHAHDLYLRAVRAIGIGGAVPCVPQAAIAQGRTYLTREWTARAMWRARRNFTREYRSFFQDADRREALLRDVHLVPLNSADT